jgi:O-antigen biosynthesis protein WbqV
VILPQAVLIFDVFMAMISFFISVYIVVGNEFFEYTPSYILKNMAVFMLISVSVFIWMQTHRTLWRYFSIEDCIPLSLAVLLSTVVYIPLMILLSQQESLPKSVPFINFLVYLTVLCLSRYIYRNAYEQHATQKKRLLAEQLVPVILAGSGHSTELFIREVMHSPALSFNPIGILSPNIREKGRRIHTVPILGTGEPIDALIKAMRGLQKRPLQIVITEADLPQEFLETVTAVSQKCGLPMMQMLPQFSMTMPEQHVDPAFVQTSIAAESAPL